MTIKKEEWKLTTRYVLTNMTKPSSLRWNPDEASADYSFNFLLRSSLLQLHFFTVLTPLPLFSAITSRSDFFGVISGSDFSSNIAACLSSIFLWWFFFVWLGDFYDGVYVALLGRVGLNDVGTRMFVCSSSLLLLWFSDTSASSEDCDG